MTARSKQIATQLADLNKIRNRQDRAVAKFNFWASQPDIDGMTARRETSMELDA